MEQKPRFLIYSSKEMAVLLVLVALVAVFAFTYGVHLGKRVPPKMEAAPTHSEIPMAESAPEAIPNRREVDAHAKGTEQAADEGLSQTLRDEVTRTGIRVETSRQVQLPKETRAEKLAKGTADAPAKVEGGRFALQLGSFPTVQEARAVQKEFGEKGVKAVIRSAKNREGKNLFRVFSGSFASRSQAEDAGKTFVIRNLVETFVVVPNPDRK